MSLTIYQVDVFTNRPFAGNPAGVCLLDAPRDDAWMAAIAAEMNLSETAFLVPNGEAFDLRWFTPTVEVDLCGHATLASAHVLWQTGRLPTDAQAVFNTRSGRLTAKRDGDWIELDFPATPPELAEAPEALLRALNVTPVTVGRSVFDYLVEVESEDVVRKLKPDYGLLATVPARGVMVTSRSSGPAYDFVSRFFGPAAGINEDPVTGSAHCCLGPFWGERLGKSEMLAYQASARGGVIRIRLAGERTLLGGQAVTVMRCELLEK
ncbi:MAG TPA: PhzF family phenazine biosynthesis protein [Dehalococcoidia bacterium]|nr:PhzF family phenazine biosynthesis protein [Dehalococcoidia bacterium]